MSSKHGASEIDVPHPRLSLVELLRFFLSLAVVIYHYFYFGPSLGIIPSRPVTFIVPYFQLAVETFFIISGFVIILSAEKKTCTEFAINRFARLGPTLLVCSTATFAALELFPIDALPEQSVAVRWLFSSTVLPLVYGKGLDWSLWSLQWEIVFYICVAALIASGSSAKKFAGLSYALLATNIVYIIGSTVHTSFLFPMRNYGAFFSLGILFYLWRAYRARPIVAGVLAVATCLYDCVVEFERTEVSILGHVAPFPTGSLIAGAIAISLFPAFATGLRSPCLDSICAALGRASFPLYVIHQLLGYVIINRAASAFPTHVLAIQCAALLTMVLISLLYSTYVEDHLKRFYQSFALSAVARRSIPLSADLPTGNC